MTSHVDEADILAFIHAYTRTYRHPPTLREIAESCGCAIGTIQHHLAKLKAQGALTWQPGIPRTIVLTEDA